MSGLSPSSKVLWLVGVAIAVFPAHAEEFSWQLSGVTSRTEGYYLHTDGWAVDGTYYVNPIDDGRGPYALASFLNPTTRVSATTNGSDSGFLDGSAYTLGGAYVLPGERWYVGANYSTAEQDWSSVIATRSDEKGFGALAGRYLGTNTTLELGLRRSERSFETLICPPSVGVCSLDDSALVPYADETTTDTISVDVFHVRQFRSLTYSLQGGVSQGEAEYEAFSPDLSVLGASAVAAWSTRTYSLAGELFPTNRLGVRVGYSQSDFDGGSDVDAYDLTATWFFKPRIAVQFSLSRTGRDDTPSEYGDIDTAAVRFIGRL